ncbi:MAG TPA: chorismate-binding protein [Candidatus Thermoplasmatota archaeon]|nr:chorismate-binding protein [Candidatus Thermoplasmatota archaeon]
MERSRLRQERAGLPWMDTLQAYRLLRAAGLRPFLLESAGPHPEARRSFIGLSPHVEVRITGRAIEERWASGAIEVLEEDPVQYLRGVTARFRFDVDEPGGFTGGWVGYLGFGFANALEPTLPPAPAGDVPDAALALCLDALVFDAGRRLVRLHCADLDGASPSAAERMAAILAALRQDDPASARAPAASGPGAAPVAGAAEWSSSFGQAAFEQSVRGLKALIHDGDLFQANLAVRWRTAGTPDGAALLQALRRANPSPYMALLEFEGFAIVSGSPEQLFAVEGGRIRSRPIAGTRKRGATPAEDEAMERELRTDRKERAEHTMLVDLVRNDVAQVAVPGTVGVPLRMGVERYRHVMHLVSQVEAQVRPGTTFMDWVAALFPGGTVTGAPKVRATQRILEAEPVARGAYTGSAGFLAWDHEAHWSILIRGLQLHGGHVDVHAGAGIVADSDPAREWRESQRKAQALLDAATGQATGEGTRVGEAGAGAAWSPPRGTRLHPAARVLLVDNYDSFVHNLADYCGVLGARVRVVRNDSDWRAALASFRPTHILLSPGPGWPGQAGCTVEVAREMLGRIPILGVCLGHQALGEAAGGRVHVHPSGPVHGSTDAVHHSGAGLFAGLPSPLEATRYHSLAVDRLPPEWVVDARLADGTVMAIRHRTHPGFGLQFHPESIATEQGLALLDAFLATTVPPRCAGAPDAEPL